MLSWFTVASTINLLALFSVIVSCKTFLNYYLKLTKLGYIFAFQTLKSWVVKTIASVNLEKAHSKVWIWFWFRNCLWKLLISVTWEYIVGLGLYSSRQIMTSYLSEKKPFTAFAQLVRDLVLCVGGTSLSFVCLFFICLSIFF